MAGKALGGSSSSLKGSGEEKDPMEEAQRFSKQMAAQAVIQSEIDKAKATADKARAEADEAKAKAERAKSGEESGKSGFKTSGEIKMGVIDLQAERQQAIQDLKDLKKEQEEAVKGLGQENQQLREKIHDQEMKVMEVTLKTQIEQLGEMIKSNAAKGTFMDQYSAMMEMAKTLGFSQPATGGDLANKIELTKLEFENTRELRRLGREDKAEERRWALELRRLDDEREARRQDAERQKKRDDMIASAPEVFGRAMARGMMEPEATEVGHISSKEKQTGIEAGLGESGEVNCSYCDKPVAIGPTAQIAVCANCGAKYPIKRVKTRSSAEEREE